MPDTMVVLDCYQFLLIVVFVEHNIFGPWGDGIFPIPSAHHNITIDLVAQPSELGEKIHLHIVLPGHDDHVEDAHSEDTGHEPNVHWSRLPLGIDFINGSRGSANNHHIAIMADLFRLIVVKSLSVITATSDRSAS